MSENSTQMSLDEVGEDNQEDSETSHQHIRQLGLEPPKEWEETPIGEIGELDTSSVDKKSNAGEKPVNLVNYMDVYRQYIINSEIDYMEVTAPDSHVERSQVVPGDILFTPSSEEPGDIGNSAVVTEEMERTLHSYHTVRLRPTSDNIKLDVGFSGWLANAPYVAKQFARRATGSTRYTLTLGDFAETRVLVPPVSEQRKIATVLYTVDQAIEKTEEIIEQSDRLFRGIMNDIFEQGVSQPDRLQETPVGRFPQSWDIVQMRSILTEKPSYGIVKTDDGGKNGVKMIRAQDIEHGKLVEDEPIRVTKEKSEEYERTKISEGNVLLSVMGTVGRSMCATQGMEGCNVNRALAVLEFDNGQVLPEFADFWFRSPHVQSYFETQKFGTAQPRLNLGFLRKMKFPVPPLNTQKDIVEILSDSEQRYWIERETKNQLQRLKQGLMQDLLSGTVRTTDTNITVPDEVAQHG